jgi:hypothetical protein
MKPCFTGKQNQHGMHFYSMHHMMVPVNKTQLCIMVCIAVCVNHNCLMQWFWCNDANTPAYCAIHINDFLGNVSSQAPILPSFSSAHVSCTFCYCLKENLLLEMFSLICKLFSCLELAHPIFSSEFTMAFHAATVFGEHIVLKSTVTAKSQRPWKLSNKCRK